MLPLPLSRSACLKPPGLHVVEMRTGEAGHAIPLVFDDGSRTEQAQIRQVIDKEAELIYLSSGDEIYIDKQYTPYDYFFNGMFPTGSVTGISSVLPTSGAVSE